MAGLAFWSKTTSGGGSTSIPGPQVTLGNNTPVAGASATSLTWGVGSNALDRAVLARSLTDGTVVATPTWLTITDTTRPVLAQGTYAVHASITADAPLTAATSVLLSIGIARAVPTKVWSLLPTTDQGGTDVFEANGTINVAGTGSGHGNLSVVLLAGNGAGTLGTGNYTVLIHLIKLA